MVENRSPIVRLSIFGTKQKVIKFVQLFLGCEIRNVDRHFHQFGSRSRSGEAHICFVHCHDEGKGRVYESSGVPSRAEPMHSTRDVGGITHWKLIGVTRGCLGVGMVLVNTGWRNLGGLWRNAGRWV